MEPTGAHWRTSSFSNGSEGGQCVEVAVLACGVAVRDTKDRTRAVHVFPVREWRAFLAGVRAGEFGAAG